MTSPLEAALDAYVAAWNEPDPTRRHGLLEQALSADAAFEGPTGIFRGRQAIADLVEAVRGRLPGAVVCRVGPAEAGSGTLRFRWQIRRADGTLVLEGVDEVEDDGQGRVLLVRMQTTESD